MDHDNETTARRPFKPGARRCESGSCSSAACLSSFTRLRRGDPPRHAIAIPSRKERCSLVCNL